MGLFQFLRGNVKSKPVSSNQPKESVTLNLRKEEAIQQLDLRKETLEVSLQKNSIHNVFARVAVVMDDSGSMEYLYRNGTVQSVLERLLPIALKFDDNGELDIWLFSNRYKRMPSITEEDFYDYVKREVLKKATWGGTYYAPVIEDIVQKYVHEEPSNIPTFVMFITDGENFDEMESEIAIRKASQHNIFFQFVGIGDENFHFLKHLDEMEGRFIDNANFFQINDINRISDEALYDLLLKEYPLWEKEARKKGLIS